MLSRMNFFPADCFLVESYLATAISICLLIRSDVDYECKVMHTPAAFVVEHFG